MAKLVVPHTIAKNNAVLFLLVLAIIIVVALVTGLSSQKIFVNKVIDGDTLVDSDYNKYRLIGINAPEKGELCYEEAKNYLDSLVFAKDVEFASYGKERYGRTLVEVYYKGANVNKEMLAAGLANAYYSESQNINWKEYLAAERVGRERGGCLWKKSVNGLCVEGERIGKTFVLRNVCNITIVTNTVIRDATASHRFKKSIKMGAGQTLTISEECGADTENAVYLCQHVFNDYGDELLIYDESGLLAFVPYGVYIS